MTNSLVRLDELLNFMVSTTMIAGDLNASSKLKLRSRFLNFQSDMTGAETVFGLLTESGLS